MTLHSDYTQSAPRIKLQYLSVFFVSLYVLLLPFEYVLSSESGTINKYIAILVVFSCVISGSIKDTIKSSNIAIILFLLFGILSRVWAISANYWNEVFFTYLKNAALFLVISQCKFTKKQSGLIMNSYVVGSLLLVVYLFTSSSVTTDSYSGRTAIAVNGGFFDPNYMAADVIMPIGFLCGVFYENLIMKKYIKGIFAVALILALFYVEILAGSRGGLLAIASTILSITLLNLKHRSIRKKILLILLILSLGFIIIMQMMPEPILERFSLDSISGEEDDGGGRIVLWQAAIKAIKENFVVGYGAGCAVPAVGLYHGVYRASHSLYLSSILEFGVFSVLLYYAIFKEIKTAYKKKLYAEVGIGIGVLIASVFLDTLSTKFFWAFLIMLFMRNSTVEGLYDKKSV